MVTNPEVVVVLPALNEGETVGRQVQAILAHPNLRAVGARRIVVVDNGSDDDTSTVALTAGAEVVREPRRGYGAACLAGAVAAVGADVLLLMDADGSDDLAGAAQVARLVVSGEADLAMGSRVCGHAERGALTPVQRAGNLVATRLMRPIYGLRISDLGPTRAMRRDTLLALDMQEMTYGWSTEMLAKAARAGLRITEIPVDYHARAAGRSKVSGTLTGSLRAGYRILATACRYARWRPDALLRPSSGAACPDAGVSEGVA
ncbi:MAG TPA: glycosyltransferase family 2 protein [Ktedonobacterales bacterium]|jgi:glycosyltransferase involved in cell wall biosynthesis|nr:glycosyltransferase family 2 protein [Ktedonobacterales bacterium]